LYVRLSSLTCFSAAAGLKPSWLGHPAAARGLEARQDRTFQTGGGIARFQ